MIHERLYDVCRVTLKKVTPLAKNVSKDDALLTMSKALADYGDNWQLQPENPTGCVRVINRHTQEYHMITLIETDLSQRHHDIERIVERQQFNWLVRSVELNGIESVTDYTVSPDSTPSIELHLADEFASEREAFGGESEVAYAYQI